MTTDARPFSIPTVWRRNTAHEEISQLTINATFNSSGPGRIVEGIFSIERPERSFAFGIAGIGQRSMAGDDEKRTYFCGHSATRSLLL